MSDTSIQVFENDEFVVLCRELNLDIDCFKDVEMEV